MVVQSLMYSFECGFVVGFLDVGLLECLRLSVEPTSHANDAIRKNKRPNRLTGVARLIGLVFHLNMMRKSIYSQTASLSSGDWFMVKTTVGLRVNYTKRGMNILRGKVEDEVTYLEEYENEDFLDLIQYIRWDDGQHSVRICYYVRPHGSEDNDWIFANRPLSVGTDVFEKLLGQARRKGWLGN
jgi:hypothetical protein